MADPALATPSRPSGTSGRTRRGRPTSPGVIPLLVLLGIGIAVPLVAVLITAVTGYGGQPSALGSLAAPVNLQIVGNTILLGVLVVVFATLMAAPLAFLMSWTRLRDQRWIDVLVMIPFMTPPYVASLAWLDFTRVRGLGDLWLGPIGPVLRDFINSPAGMAMIMAGEIFPFLYLLLRNHLDAIPASTDEMAGVAGATAWQRFRRVLLPLSTVNFSLGALVVFIRAIGEFGAPVTIGNRIGFHVLVSQIYRNVTIAPLDFPTAAAFSSVLLTLGVGVWAIQQWVARKPTHFGGRVSRRRTVRLGAWWAPAWLWITVIMLATVVIPYVSVVIGAMTILRSRPPSPDNLTFDYFGIVLTTGDGLSALETSAGLSLAGATIATVLGTAVVLATGRRPRRAGRIADVLAIAPDMVPTIVLAIGFIFLWNSPLLPATPYNSPWILVIAYSVIFLPIVVQSIRGVRGSIDERLLEAASVSGAGRVQTMVRVMLPLLLPGIASGWLLAFLIGVREVVASSLIRPASVNLLSPWIIAEFDRGDRAGAMAMTVIGVVSSTLILVLVQVWNQRRASRRLR